MVSEAATTQLLEIAEQVIQLLPEHLSSRYFAVRARVTAADTPARPSTPFNDQTINNNVLQEVLASINDNVRRLRLASVEFAPGPAPSETPAPASSVLSPENQVHSAMQRLTLQMTHTLDAARRALAVERASVGRLEAMQRETESTAAAARAAGDAAAADVRRLTADLAARDAENDQLRAAAAAALQRAQAAGEGAQTIKRRLASVESELQQQRHETAAAAADRDRESDVQLAQAREELLGARREIEKLGQTLDEERRGRKCDVDALRMQLTAQTQRVEALRESLRRMGNAPPPSTTSRVTNDQPKPAAVLAPSPRVPSPIVAPPPARRPAPSADLSTTTTTRRSSVTRATMSRNGFPNL